MYVCLCILCCCDCTNKQHRQGVESLSGQLRHSCFVHIVAYGRVRLYRVGGRCLFLMPRITPRWRWQATNKHESLVVLMDRDQLQTNTNLGTHGWKSASLVVSFTKTRPFEVKSLASPMYGFSLERSSNLWSAQNFTECHPIFWTFRWILRYNI